MDDAELISAAREQYANEDLEIDSDADTSRADVGAWVQAWVWVKYPENVDAKDD